MNIYLNYGLIIVKIYDDILYLNIKSNSMENINIIVRMLNYNLKCFKIKNVIKILGYGYIPYNNYKDYKDYKDKNSCYYIHESGNFIFNINSNIDPNIYLDKKILNNIILSSLNKFVYNL